MANTYEPTAWAYAEVVKVEDQQDGSVRVYGRPTHEVEDLDHQIADREWAKQALPEWYSTGANVRQMHQPIAIGKGEKLEFDENDDPWLTARIIDPNAVKLFKEGVLQGFSIGIKDPIIKHDQAAKNGRIVGGKIVEISGVDRPAVPTAKTVIMKMIGPGEYMDMQTGFSMKSAKHPTDGDEVNPDDFDAEGNPVHQPGHVQEEEPTIISQDTHSVNVKVGDKVYTVPVDMDSNGNVVVGEPYEVPGIEPAEGTSENPEEDMASGEKGVSRTEKAVWSTAYQDDLPDSCFAYVAPGGKKEDGKTDPRSLRHLPYKDKDGKVDPDHVRNALARLDQTDIPADAKAEAKRKLEAAAKEVGIDVNEKGVQGDLVKAAMTVAQDQKVLCQKCKKTVTIEKTFDASVLDGGARVSGKGSCGHTVTKFIKAAEMDADGDKDEKTEDTQEYSENKGAEGAEDAVDKPSMEKEAGGDESDKPDEDPETAEEDKELEKFVRVLDKWAQSRGLFKDANPEDTESAEETRKRKIKDLRDAHATLGDKIDEYEKCMSGTAEKAADADGGPSRVHFDNPKEVIAELKRQVKEMMRLVDDGEDEMGHDEKESEGSLGEDVVPGEKKPKGDGRINFTEGDMKTIAADIAKAAVANTRGASAPDIAKAVADSVKGVMEPLLKRVEQVEHMAQPATAFQIPMDKNYAMNGQQEEDRSNATKAVQEQMRNLDPKTRDAVLAKAIAAQRGWN